MSLRYDKRFLVDEAVNWWESKLTLEGEEYAESLFSLGRDQIVGRLIYLVKVRVKNGGWRPGQYFWGCELRRFGTSRKLPDRCNLVHQALKPSGIESAEAAGWPEDAIMYVDPGRVIVKYPDRTEVVYGDWADE